MSDPIAAPPDVDDLPAAAQAYADALVMSLTTCMGHDLTIHVELGHETLSTGDRAVELRERAANLKRIAAQVTAEERRLREQRGRHG